jgi:putative phage-type endonuclease
MANINTMNPQFIQGTPQWHALRKTKIAASDAPAIMQVSPWKTPLDVWNEKCHLPCKDKKSPFMQRGLDLEPQALQTFEQITGYLMMPKVVLHPTIDYLMASLDGMELSGKAIVEIKCPGQIDHNCALDGEVPAKYIPQLMHQMECSGLKKAYYFSYTLTSYKVLEVHFDEKYVENLLKEEAEFWNCVLTKTEPKSKKNYIQMNSQEWTDAANQYKEIGRQISLLEDQRKAYKDCLFAMANGMQTQGAGVTLSKITRRGKVDVDALAKDAKLDPEKYREPSKEEWRIT